MRLLGGLDVSVDTTDCEFLDVDRCGDMNATTVDEVIAITAEEYTDQKNVKAEMESTQRWAATLLPKKIVYGTTSHEILDPVKVDEGRPEELGLMKEHNMHELATTRDARGTSHVHAKWLTVVTMSDADW